jgi:hypothetical protein
MAIAITTLPSRCSLYQALLWVAEERPPIEDFIFDSLPDPSGVAVDEKHKLLVALKTGTVRAEGILWGLRGPIITLENPLTEIEPKYWEWQKVDWEDSVLWTDSFGDGRNDGQFTEITVPAGALLKTFPSDERPLALQALSREGSSRRGRPRKFNLPAFYAEIAVRADLDGLPDKQAELERAMAEWCSLTWGEVPGESTMRQYVSPIYSHPRKARK